MKEFLEIQPFVPLLDIPLNLDRDDDEDEWKITKMGIDAALVNGTTSYLFKGCYFIFTKNNLYTLKNLVFNLKVL